MKRLPLTTFAISICLLCSLGTAPAALGSGSITGTATAAGTALPIAGLSVCAEEDFVGGVSSGCTTTDSGGHYRIDGLAAGASYQVEFSALGDLNYLTQFFHGKEGLGTWDRVTVADGATTEAIDAVMNPGGQITGQISEQGTGAAAVGVDVCVLDPATNPRAEEFERCAQSDQAGHYTVRSLPAGTYIVVFAPTRRSGGAGTFQEQYYDSATARATATTVSVAPPETVSDIDASLVNMLATRLLRTQGSRTVTPRAGARVRFRFSAAGPLRGFVCKRDRGPWRSCRSPISFWAPVGRHVFRVRAVGLNGLRGPVALRLFRIARK